MRILAQFFIGLVACLYLSAQVFAAADSTSLNPNLVPANPSQKVANLAYITFASTVGASALMGQCPAGLTLVSGSGTHVPPIPGLWDTEQYYWQCIQSLTAWSNSQENGEIQPYDGLDYGKSYSTNLVDNSQDGKPVWTSDPQFDPQNVTYTYFNFPGNQFIPTGVGGSGVVCPTAGGSVTISCKNGLGQPIPGMNGTFYGVDAPKVFYIGPGDSATCQVTRTYASGPACNGTVTIPSGQAKVMACCQGNWYCKTGSWGDPGLTTCNQCPCGNPGQPACGPGNCS